MVGTYPLSQGQGSVKVTKEGLYYRICCRCQLSEKGMFRLVAVTEAGRVDLGILAPVGEFFCLQKRIPCKQMGEIPPQFHLISGDRGNFVPVYPEEPFRYISRLKDSFLEIRGGQVGIVIK